MSLFADFSLFRPFSAPFYPLISMNSHNIGPSVGGMRFAICRATTINLEKGTLTIQRFTANVEFPKGVKAMLKREETMDQRYVSKQSYLGSNNTTHKRYQENVKKVTGPTISHPDYGEIFLLRPNEVPHSTLFLFDVNKFWFIDMKENKQTEKMTIRPFIHKLRGYWYPV